VTQRSNASSPVHAISKVGVRTSSSSVSWLRSKSQRSLASEIPHPPAEKKRYARNKNAHSSLARYGVGGHYAHHFDWGALAPGTRAGRVSSFMVYLSANCVGGGTNFPNLDMPVDKRWCDYLECDGQEQGVTFKAVKGSAVYWENFRPDGRGYEEVWHAGLPVKEGMKIGLNIWSWYQPGYVPPEPAAQKTEL